jgi:peptidoglycan/LPS O-acetylase OafA/YrhL
MEQKMRYVLALVGIALIGCGYLMTVDIIATFEQTQHGLLPATLITGSFAGFFILGILTEIATSRDFLAMRLIVLAIFASLAGMFLYYFFCGITDTDLVKPEVEALLVTSMGTLLLLMGIFPNLGKDAD